MSDFQGAAYELGDPLERLNASIDFEIFRNLLETNLSKIAKGREEESLMIMF